MAGVIQVPSWSRPEAVAQPATTSAKAVSALRRNRPEARVRAKRRGRWNSWGKSTSRGAGDHHRIGSPSLNQGKMPWL